MTQSGQGEEPSPREAREGIVLPSDGGEPLLPGMLNAQAPVGPYGGAHNGSYNAPQAGGHNGPQAATPTGGQAWGTPWGPDQSQSPAPQPGEGWGAQPAQPWNEPEQHQPPADQWGASAGHGQPAPLPPAYGSPTAPGPYGGALPPAADEGATQYIPPVAAAVDEGATQYIPPVAPGALPPEVGGAHAASSEATQFLGRGQQPGAGPMPPAAGPDAEPTQYIPPVTDQAPYGMQQGGDRQPPAEFDNLFRSGPGGESPAGATQQMPRFEQPPAQAGYAQQQTSYPPPETLYSPTGGDDGRGGRGGRSRSRTPLIAGIGIGIVVLGVGAGALLGGGGGDDGTDKNQPVSATAPATDGSASPAADPAKQQAVALDKLLSDSGDSRASVIQAVANVKGCKNLSQAASDLRSAAQQRNQLVTRLAGLSVDKLPNNAALTSALNQAWKASASADNHYAAWADQVGGKKGCKKGQARATGQTGAGNRASGTASQQKVKASQLWNAIAKQYGLTQRQPTQL
ncbi:hypothetical protein LXH13_23080 [Streptomyces spinosirectus]|uniref:hypothetical protein n=1 Tax=Streptomyces spinosirectus TaxID=2906474 RepID=UPI001F2CAF2D|nr:hypothetical protein [Streptomyces spinosirectus]UIR19745.1 hypothetical protein LXH13_23080 [Streptomyces spinosirectus]